MKTHETIKTQTDAEKAGYTVDTHVYPWVAYKGPRFNPTEWFNVETRLETALRALLRDRNTESL